MKIGYNIPDMTHLRYYVPLVKALQRVAPGLRHEFVTVGGTSKYNSVHRDGNFERFVEIVNELDVTITRGESNVPYDVLFTVEGYNCGLVGRKIYAIQHGFDYHGSAPGCSPDTVHIMSAQEYADDLHSRIPARQAIVSPLPISMWELEWTRCEMIKGQRLVTIFYPENGLHDLVKDVVNRFRLEGWVVFIKQRAKNQSVPDLDVAVFYDRDWYPSESIYLPAMSDACIGFGTAAYTDLVPVGLNFIDVPVPEYSRSYLKPAHPCMFVLDPGSTAEQIVEAAVKCRRAPIPGNAEAIDEFVRGLL